MRVFWLTILVLCGILLGQGQSQQQKALQQEQAKEEPNNGGSFYINGVLQDGHVQLCHKQFLLFWRLRMDSAKGDWHLLNDEDKRFLKEVQEKITSGQYQQSRIEYFSLEGRLPE